jgi:hypothetical protein
MELEPLLLESVSFDSGQDLSYIYGTAFHHGKGERNVLLLSLFFLFTLLFTPALLLLPLIFSLLLIFFFFRMFHQVSLRLVFLRRHSGPRSPPL